MNYALSENEERLVREQEKKLSKKPTSMTREALHVSGSSWGKDHLYALRVVHLYDIPLDRFFDAQYLPDDSHPVYSQAAREITSLDEDTIRNLDIRSIPNFTNHPFGRFFQHLANAVSTKPPAIPHTNRAQSTGEISSSGDEDKGEDIARLCVQELCNAILLKGNMGVLNAKWSLAVNEVSQKSKVWLGNRPPLNVENDGGIVLHCFSSHSGSTRLGNVPVVSFEAKRRHAGGKKHGAGEAEEFDEDLLGQEVAELLANVMTSCKMAEGGAWKAQDAWCLSIHGTEIRLITAHFPEMYLKMVNSMVMRPSQKLVVFRSKPFNLKYDSDRPLAIKAIIALLEWLKSGHSKQVLLESVLADG